VIHCLQGELLSALITKVIEIINIFVVESCVRTCVMLFDIIICGPFGKVEVHFHHWHIITQWQCRCHLASALIMQIVVQFYNSS